MNRIVPIILLAITLFSIRVSATTINVGQSQYMVSISTNTVKLTEDKRVISEYDFTFIYQGTNYNTVIRKAIPIDLDTDGTQELFVLLDPPDMMSPRIVILYYENGAIQKLLEGINLFAIRYEDSKKIDMHTLTLGADVKFYFEDGEPEDSIMKVRLLQAAKDQQIGLVLFPNFKHLQPGPWPYLVDARHLHYDGENCEELSFDSPTDIQSTSSNQLLIIYNNLLSLLEIRELDKAIGSIDYGFFTVEYDDIISKVEEKGEYYAIHLRNNQEMSLKKSKVKFNYCNKGKWWRKSP